MGIFSSVAKITDPGDFFGSRAAESAASTAKDLGYQNIALQKDWMEYTKGQNQPFQDSALRALPMQEAMMGLYGAAAQQEQIDELQNSGLYSSMVSQGENAIARNQQATGGFRSGSTNIGLAQNSQNVLQNLYDKKLAGLGALSGRGLQSQQLNQQGGQYSLSEIGNTMGQIGNVGINAAANQQNKAMGFVGMAATAFSDKRLKDDIVFTGKINGHNTYRWVWNELAEDLFGLVGASFGTIAQEVIKKNKEAITTDSGYLKVNYEMIGVPYGV